MSNSSLVSYTRLSPNHSGRRTHDIDTITIHCMAGNLSVESCGALFAQSARQASSNYGIGSDGRIALYVPEDNRSWCTYSRENDQRAITIEVANTQASDPWPISAKAYSALLDLVFDICQRNGITELRWKGDKTLAGQPDKQNMTVHQWFARTACPGGHLYALHGSIAEEVNRRLRAWGNAIWQSGDEDKQIKYIVQITASVLNVRAEASSNSRICTTVKRGEYYTIVAESNGWGKLKSGAGWIFLAYTKKIA